MYLIKSSKGFWLAGGYGYTKTKADAGVFTYEEMQHLNLNLDGCTLITTDRLPLGLDAHEDAKFDFLEWEYEDYQMSIYERRHCGPF